MPQFETERPGAPNQTVRARDAADAVRRAAEVPDTAQVDIGPPTGPDGWADATIDGTPAGRVRPHARMKFRRD
ncbi:MAG TPA: hypothetical protein VGB53_01225 [Rubricoccaceae bacterium]|jgi:hypothetical protein